MLATPLEASVAFRETVTFEMYQPFEPKVPERTAVVVGGVVSIKMLAECSASTRPATSTA